MVNEYCPYVVNCILILRVGGAAFFVVVVLGVLSQLGICSVPFVVGNSPSILVTEMEGWFDVIVP